MTRLLGLTFVVGFCLLLAGCPAKEYRYTDPNYKVSVSYPGTVDLFSDEELLREQLEKDGPSEQAVDRPKLLFAMTTMNRGQLTFSVHQLPQGHNLTADRYYEVSTAKELAALQVDIVEPKSEVSVNGNAFLKVGFTVQAQDQVIRSRIYQHLDVPSGKVLVITTSARQEDWNRDESQMEAIVHSTKFAW